MFTELQRTWLASFPHCPPLRHVLQRTYSERWLRVHSLADAKRLPTGSDDEREVLRRHELVADRLLANSDECALVVAYANGYRGKDEPPSVTDFGLEIADGWPKQWTADQPVHWGTGPHWETHIPLP